MEEMVRDISALKVIFENKRGDLSMIKNIAHFLLVCSTGFRAYIFKGKKC